MKKVNSFFIDYLTTPLWGLADIDEITEYDGVDPDNEMEMRKIIRDTLLSEFMNQPERFRDAAKTALSYYLTTDKADFERIFNAHLPPFDPPSPPRKFFVWIWEEFFRSESYQLENIEEYKEVKRIEEPLMYSIKK